MKHIPCDLCGSEKQRLRYTTRDRFFPVDGAFKLVQCSGCGLLYLNPQPEAEDLKKHYPPDNYYAYSDADDRQDITTDTRLGGLRSLRASVEKLLSTVFPALTNELELEFTWTNPAKEGGRILDVGCGAGDKLSFYRGKGFTTFGVEIDPTASEKARRKGHEVFCGNVEEAGFPGEYFDIVTFPQSLEHLLSPRRALMEAGRILKPGGRIYVSVPNLGGIQARIFRDWFYAIDSPRHLFCFTRGTIAKLLASAGFSVDHYLTTSIPGGVSFSLEYWLNDAFSRQAPFYYGQMKLKWWYVLMEPLLFGPRIIVDLLRLGSCILISGHRK